MTCKGDWKIQSVSRRQVIWENWPKGVYWRCYALHVAGLCLCLIITGLSKEICHGSIYALH